MAGRRGAFIWRILLHHMENPPIDWEVGEGGHYAFGLAWLIARGQILGRNPDRSLKSVPPSYSLLLLRLFYSK